MAMIVVSDTSPLSELMIKSWVWGKIGMVSSTPCVAMDEQRSQAYLSLIQELLACLGEVSGGDRESD
jgi:hypothetical protein